MKRCIFNTGAIAVLLLSATLSYGQAQQSNEIADSLKQELLKAKPDTNKVDILNRLSVELNKAQPDQSLKYGLDAIAEARRIKWGKGLAESNHNTGKAYSSLGNDTAALEHLFIALQLWNALLQENSPKKIEPERAKTLFNIAVSYNNTGAYQRAIKYYNEALKIQTEYKISAGVAKCYNNLGNVYVRLSDYPNAIDAFLKSAKIKEELGDKKGSSSSLLNAGVVYTKMNNYPKALEYFFSTLKIVEDAGDKAVTQACYTNIGATYYYLGTGLCEESDAIKYLEQALKYHNKALKLHEEFGDKRKAGFHFSNIANDYKSLGDKSTEQSVRKEYYKNAIDFYLKAIELDQKTGKSTDIPVYYSGLGKVYHALQQYPEAEKNLLEALKLRENNGLWSSEGYLLELALSELYAGMNRHDLALEHFKTATNINDSIAGTNQAELIAELNSKYESKKKDQEITLLTQQQSIQTLKLQEQENLLKYHLLLGAQKAKDLQLNQQQMAIQALELDKSNYLLKEQEHGLSEKENQLAIVRKDKATQAVLLKTTKKNRNMIIASLLGLFFFTGLLLHYRNQRNNLAFKHKLTETELNLFRSQMNPHFMFNALNSIHSYVVTNETDNAAAYLEKFSQLMRTILENSSNPLVSLRDDLKALDLYLELESERLGNKFSYEINVSPDIDKDKVLVPPMLLQPFLENSVWHGMQEKDRGGKIQLHVDKNGNQLQCVITDNGNGLRKKEVNGNKDKKSYGISITRQRLENLNKTQKTNAYCNVNEILDENAVPSGVRVEIGLPIEMDE